MVMWWRHLAYNVPKWQHFWFVHVPDVMFRKYAVHTLAGMVFLAHVPLAIYKVRNIDTGRAHYHSVYTVYRDTDPQVEHIRPPEDYPPKWVNVRENRSWKTVKNDYGF